MIRIVVRLTIISLLYMKGWPVFVKLLKWALVAIIAILGLVFLLGGARLLLLGGSAYFALIGLVLVVCAFVTSRTPRTGSWVYFAALVATVVWAVADAGLAFWPFFSRTFLFVALAPLFALLAYLVGGEGRKTAAAGAILSSIAVVALLGGMFFTHGQFADGAPTDRVSVNTFGGGDWSHWGKDSAGTRFSALQAITPANVEHLKIAWTYRTGDIAEGGVGAEFQNTPLQIGDTLFVCTPRNIVIALDADSGHERWRFDPHAQAPDWQRCRGLGYVSAEQGGGRARIVLTTIDARLFQLDPLTGRPVESFGAGGVVSLGRRMGEIKPGFYTQTSAPLVADGLIVLGGRVLDNYELGEPSGVIRAYDAVTGDLKWAWDLGRPEISSVDAARGTDAFIRGTPNAWSTLSFDAQRGLVFVPMGNATPDFWGGNRTPQAEQFSSSLVALNIADGTLRWKFQTVHHDLWDYDLPSQPMLVDVPQGGGRSIAAVVVPTKTGNLFVLDRDTGRPVKEVREVPVPPGPTDIVGERFSPTQPMSTGMPLIGNGHLREADMWGATPIDQMLCRIRFRGLRYDGMFTPISTQPTLQSPGVIGGMNWGSGAYEPNTGTIFINDIRLPSIARLIPRKDVDPSKAGGPESGLQAQFGTPHGLTVEMFMSALQVPCVAPPFGTMTAIDLAAGTIRWQTPIGTVRDMGPLGIKAGLPIPIGMPTLGGPIVTASGLLFYSGTSDAYLRALDSRTGRELWKGRLPVGGQAAPMTYRSPKTGRQYVVVTAGGSRNAAARGDYVIAYALP